jgi:hypothetical protein
MPFKSKAQRKFLFAKKPKIAKKFAEHTPKGTQLPERVTPQKRAKRKKTTTRKR